MKKQQIFRISASIMMVVFFGLRHQVGKPIDCGFPGEMNHEQIIERDQMMNTFWHKVFFTRSECRKISTAEARRHLIENGWRPD